ncbi:iron-sulfur cluster-binding domain-containing protein [Rhodococcus sp. IEGM 1408]|uniref:flavin reductase family protein n=1 Tax=Rhodococcus sp. IEGM 1408 TaxID=3082220 RepID=UPI002955C5BC|nr:iron-sulfur cluster-binding domain-containing protein [Rhodococcus sp. IEGM 1408]MDV8000925.1 iron-sulfur cluster-binding domain-containing protein [Rhodococcus sp. IEGM 1408]
MTAPTISRLFSRGITRTLLTPHPPEHYVRSLGLAWSDDPTGATVVAVDRPVPDVTVLTLRLPTGVDRPVPGAALEIGVVVDGVVHRRHYSPVDAATRADRLATIAVRRHPGGVVSEYLWTEAVPGMRLLLGDPVGEISLPENRPADVLLVSGGSGITPMLAIASTLAGEGHCVKNRSGENDSRYGKAGRVAWLHYARRAEDVPFADRIRELSRAGVDVRVVATTGDPSPEGLAGHLTAEHLSNVAPWHADATVFLCGPEGLADGLADALGAERYAGVLRERFSATTGPVPDGDGGTVTHLTSGVSAHNAGTTLLEGAEAAGLNPKHGCRMGICHTCTAVRVSGATRDLRTGEVDTTPGCHVQICVSAPVGDVEIEL